jgi:hypothetical protein
MNSCVASRNAIVQQHRADAISATLVSSRSGEVLYEPSERALAR